MICQVIYGIILLGVRRGIEVVRDVVAVEAINRDGAASSVSVDISSNSFVRIPNSPDGIRALHHVDGIKVVYTRGSIHPVQRDGVGLLRGEYVSGCSNLVGIPKFSNRVLVLCDGGCIEVVSPSHTVCREQRKSTPRVSTSSRYCISLP